MRGQEPRNVTSPAVDHAIYLQFLNINLIAGGVEHEQQAPPDAAQATSSTKILTRGAERHGAAGTGTELIEST